MKINVVYALSRRQVALNVELPDGATVKEALEKSGILRQFPEIDLAKQKVGIFSKITKLDAPVSDGDRIEIYRPITADPKNVRRKTKEDGSEESV